MWTRFTKRYFAATKKQKNKFQRGQAMLEYLLLILMAVSMFMVVVRPHMLKLEKQIEKSMKSGIFNIDSSGGGFYYFPIK